jgi:hypothetical protein
MRIGVDTRQTQVGDKVLGIAQMPPQVRVNDAIAANPENRRYQNTSNHARERCDGLQHRRHPRPPVVFYG